MADERQGDDEKRDERTVETSDEHTVELDRGVPEPEAYPYLGDLDAGLPVTSRQPPAATTSPGTPPAPPGRRERRAIAIAVGAVLLLLLVGVVVWLLLASNDTKAVPAVQGLPLEQAVQRLESAGFEVDIANEPSDAPSGPVFAQDPAAGTDADEGSTVQLTVSSGPDTVAVPNAVGLAEAEARDRLVAAGFQVESTGVFSEREPGTVASQTPAAGAEANPGSTVSIEVSKGTGLVRVPNVVGLTRGQAEAELSNVQLEANVVEVPSDEPVGTVVAQNPVGGQAQQGSAVRLNVSAGR